MTPRVMDPRALAGFYLLSELRKRDIDPFPRSSEKASETASEGRSSHEG